jgi:hypothetical protein
LVGNAAEGAAFSPEQSADPAAFLHAKIEESRAPEMATLVKSRLVPFIVFLRQSSGASHPQEFRICFKYSICDLVCSTAS